MAGLFSLLLLAGVTCFAAVVAIGLQWLLLRYAVRLMQPAAVRQVRPTLRLAQGAAQLARAYASAQRK